MGYKETQCNGSTGYCWCVNGYGKVFWRSKKRGSVNCGVKSCARARANVLARRRPGFVGAYIPSCKPDGTYTTKQCHGSTGYCWCLNGKGKEIKGTRKRGRVNCGGKPVIPVKPVKPVIPVKPVNPTTLKIFFGKWNLVFPHMKFNLIFKPGKITLNGKTIKVFPSKNKRYPASQGWFIFIYKTWTYYIRRTRIGFVTFRMNSKGKIVKGTGVKPVTPVNPVKPGKKYTCAFKIGD